MIDAKQNANYEKLEGNIKKKLLSLKKILVKGCSFLLTDLISEDGKASNLIRTPKHRKRRKYKENKTRIRISFSVR